MRMERCRAQWWLRRPPANVHVVENSEAGIVEERRGNM